MPTKKSPKRPTKKSPVRPSRAAKTKAIATIDDITTGLDQMGVLDSNSARDRKSFDMSFVFPRMCYEYIKERVKRENFEFFVPVYPNSYFKPKVDEETGMWLTLQTRVAPVFIHPNRQLFAQSKNDKHNLDTHENTAFQGVTTEVAKKYKDTPDKEIWTEPVAYPLKFKCKSNKKDLIWDVQNYPNNTVSVDDFGGQQWFSVLCITCTSVDEPEQENKGTRRFVEAGESLDDINGFATPTAAAAAARAARNARMNDDDSL